MKKFVIAAILSLALSGHGVAETWTSLPNDGGYKKLSTRIANSSQPQPAAKVVETAKQFLGLPYVWAGASPVNGFDCSGYTYEVFRLNGYTIPRMADIQFHETERVSRDNLRAGDLVFFTTYLEGPSHVGIYLENGDFIHASSAGEGVIISNLDTGYYKERFLGGGRPEDWVAATVASRTVPQQEPAPAETTSPAQSNEQPTEIAKPKKTAKAIAKISGVDQEELDIEDPLSEDSVAASSTEMPQGRSYKDPFTKQETYRTTKSRYYSQAHTETSSDKEAALLDARQTAGELVSIALNPIRRYARQVEQGLNEVVDDWFGLDSGDAS